MIRMGDTLIVTSKEFKWLSEAPNGIYAKPCPSGGQDAFLHGLKIVVSPYLDGAVPTRLQQLATGLFTMFKQKEVW